LVMLVRVWAVWAGGIGWPGIGIWRAFCVLCIGGVSVFKRKGRRMKNGKKERTIPGKINLDLSSAHSTFRFPPPAPRQSSNSKRG
jgi:hypothetical protein